MTLGNAKVSRNASKAFVINNLGIRNTPIRTYHMLCNFRFALNLDSADILTLSLLALCESKGFSANEMSLE